ncbi:MAG: DMT family transporter [Monoglobales bacterium]
MGLFLILIFNLLALGESLLTRAYAKKHGDGGFIFNAILCLFALLFYIITAKDGLNFPPELWIYGLLSGLMFVGGYYSYFVAVKKGSYTLTGIISSFKLIFTFCFGIFYLNEPSTPLSYLGLLFVFLSIFLMNYNRSEKKTFSVIWLVCSIASAVCNGVIGILARLQQVVFNNETTTEFLIISLSVSFLFMLIAGLISDRGKILLTVKRSFFYCAGSGVANGLKNVLGIFIYLFIPISVATPLTTGVGMVLTFTVSLLFLKERFNKVQLCGVALGAASVVLLSI